MRFFILWILLLEPVLNVNGFYTISPYSYCGGDPVNYIDPNGCEIQGVTNYDAAMIVDDIRAMFPGDEFNNFRGLIVQNGKNQNGKSLAPISNDNLSSALSGVTLTEDQQALVNILINTINSKDIHKVEYIQGTGVLSSQAEASFLPPFMNGPLGLYMNQILEVNGGLPLYFIINEGGDGVTTHTKKGSHSLIILDGEHPNGRAVTTGHEVLGHGRSWVCGFGDSYQNVEAIRTENLILRVMGIHFINTGENHNVERIPIPNPSFLPSFR